MNTNPNDGAFPIPNEQFGLTKLEEFASRNLAAMIPVIEHWCIQNGKALSDDARLTYAQDAISWAKSLITALNDQP